jgi:DhnA family fructose-bisphosphate aldolase class Ia
MDGKKTIRMNRILVSSKAVIVPMDHGVMEKTISQVEKGGASAVLLQNGLIKSLKSPPPRAAA